MQPAPPGTPVRSARVPDEDARDRLRVLEQGQEIFDRHVLADVGQALEAARRLMVRSTGSGTASPVSITISVSTPELKGNASLTVSPIRIRNSLTVSGTWKVQTPSAVAAVPSTFPSPSRTSIGVTPFVRLPVDLDVVDAAKDDLRWIRHARLRRQRRRANHERKASQYRDSERSRGDRPSLEEEFSYTNTFPPGGEECTRFAFAPSQQ